MADLTQTQAALNARIIGASPATGITDNYANVDSNGGLMVVGEGTAGTPTGGVLTIQGITAGTAVNVTGSNFPLVVDTNYGVVGASTLRVAAQIGNATGSADFNSGATSAQTLRVQANQGAVGASAWLTTDSADGPVTPGTVATKSILLGGQFNTALPTVSNTQQSAIQIDSSARLIIAPLTNSSIVKAQLQDNAGAAITLGQKTMVNSVPVVLASDQVLTVTSSPLPASGSKFSFGRISTSASTQVPVEETTYTEQIVNAQRSLASSNAGDIAGGTGARTVLITYYDQTGAGPFTESVAMNGTATANTVGTNICYIEKLQVTSVGSAGSNQGTITLFTAINKGGTTITTIATGDSQTFHAHHYVPLGKTCYISGFSVGNNASSSGAGALFILKASTPTVANSQELQVSDFVTIAGAANTDTRSYGSPIQVTGPARVRAYVAPYATSATTQYASFDFIDN
jgi:hypothetical protein